MDKINFNRGIEGYHTFDSGQKEKAQLPDSRQISQPGDAVKDHVATYFNKFNQAAEDLNRHMKPKISDPNLLAPSGYMKTYRKTLRKLRRLKGKTAKEKKIIRDALAVLETVGDDMGQLNDYIACLIKV